MFKLVVLCAFLAAAAAEPGLLTPITYSSNYLAPVSTYPYYSNGLSSLVYSSPVVSSPAITYGAPAVAAHLIKKRSAAFASSYVAQSPYTTTLLLASYSAGISAYSPIATTYGAAFPSLYSSPLYTTGHLIKKRSAVFPLQSTYIAPTTYTTAGHLIPQTYAQSTVIASPFYPGSAYSYSVPFIKK